jgi:hypothetical protein
MNLAFLILSLFLYTSRPGQLQTTVTWTKETALHPDEVIYFEPGENLVWDDFRGTPPPGDRAAAVTVSGFGYQANVRTSGGSGNLDIKVYCYFHKDKSWVKPGRNTPYILKHEQHHFDISYIAASIFLEKLRSANFTTSNYDHLLAQIYDESTDIMNSMQDDYDGQTKNGQLRNMQAEWNNTVDTQINDIIR